MKQVGVWFPLLRLKFVGLFGSCFVVGDNAFVAANVTAVPDTYHIELWANLELFSLFWFRYATKYHSRLRLERQR